MGKVRQLLTFGIARNLIVNLHKVGLIMENISSSLTELSKEATLQGCGGIGKCDFAFCSDTRTWPKRDAKEAKASFVIS